MAQNTPNFIKFLHSPSKNPSKTPKIPSKPLKMLSKSPNKLLINSYDDTCGTSANCTATLTVPKEMAAPVCVEIGVFSGFFI
jgi:hypothetical protein